MLPISLAPLLKSGPFRFEKFADGFGQFRQAEVRKIAGSLADEFKVGRCKIAAGKGNLRLKHGLPPLFIPYPKRKRMSREKCIGVRKMLGAAADLTFDDRTRRDKAGIMHLRSSAERTACRAVKTTA
jgi:hypothetical protein